MSYPLIIQGGMGAAVSDWNLAKAVSKEGQLGVVSGTALDMALVRRLQLGDSGGNIRRAMEHFPIQEIIKRIMDEFFIPGGKKASDAFKLSHMFSLNPSKMLQELNIVGNFVEVFLAKEEHDNLVGINFLEKIQLPNLSGIYGAMLAGVDIIIMGAGIPREIPGILDKLVNHEEVSMKINVIGAQTAGDFKLTFNPSAIIDKILPPLKRPEFFPIISSAVLALTLFKKSTGKVNGFIVEGATAGGHNAPPRGAMKLDENGEPIYGEKDKVDLGKIKNLGLPFWLAGGWGSPGKLKEATELGAAGIQVGTAFAGTAESGYAESWKKLILEAINNGTAKVFTDPVASPTGFPFKVLNIKGTNSEKDIYENRTRICDLGFLRHLFLKSNGEIGYRCPSEPENIYVKKGGRLEDAVGRKCLCNGLMANVGYHQIQKGGYEEKPLLTMGDDVLNLRHFLSDTKKSYSVKEVVDYLLGGA